MTFDWQFPARVERVVDGDTLDVRADLGFRTYAKVRVRLQGVDTAEIYGVKHESEEYADGKVHQEFVRQWVEDSDDLTLRTFKETGKYGRWIGDLERPSGDTLTGALVVEYPEVEDK